MSAPASQSCPFAERTAALARGALRGSEQREAERHLEDCAACRAAYAEATEDRFPRIPQYTIIERIGEGGFGVVYKAIHHTKRRTEALKVLFGKTPVRTAYFENEVHLIARLRHPHIAILYEAQLDRSPLYYTMEYVEGEQLDHYVRRVRLPLVRRIELVRTIAGAIGYAHSQGVAHRDLKPQNVLIDAAGQPHIVDFGIAKRLGLHDEAGPASSPEGPIGTLGYIAPEQLDGQPVDERADIFALGVLLYHCVTGRLPIEARDPWAVYGALAAAQVAGAPDLAAIVGKCVARNPAERYRTCEELVTELDRYLAGTPVRAQRDARLGYRAARGLTFIVRHRPLLVRLFIVAVVAALFTTLSWRAEARWVAPAEQDERVALIRISPTTFAAARAGRIGADVPAFTPYDRSSWRLLHGRLMERLALAKPLVVTWDVYFADCLPQFDEGLIAGMQALRAADVPVVVGVGALDVNSEPTECPTILQAASTYGTLAATDPGSRLRDWKLPACIQRGFAAPVPSLTVAAYAAALQPGAELELVAEKTQVVLRFRKRDPPPGALRWYRNERTIPCKQVGIEAPNRVLWPGDRLSLMTIPAIQEPARKPQIFEYEDVLAADPKALTRWFAGRAVLIGDMLPGRDMHKTVEGDTVYGCEVQAQVLQSLLSGERVVPFQRRTLALLILLWALAGGVIATLVPCAPRFTLRWVTAAALTLALGGAVLLLLGARFVTGVWGIHATLAAASIMAVGGLAFLARFVRDQQIRLAPEINWPAASENPSTRSAAATTLASRGGGSSLDLTRVLPAGAEPAEPRAERPD